MSYTRQDANIEETEEFLTKYNIPTVSDQFPDYWAGAMKYCQDKGLRLPTVADYEKISAAMMQPGVVINEDMMDWFMKYYHGDDYKEQGWYDYTYYFFSFFFSYFINCFFDFFSCAVKHILIAFFKTINCFLLFGFNLSMSLTE